MSNDVLDDYLGELLLEAVPAAAVAAPATPAKPAVVEVPGDSPELEAVFEAALAEAQAKPAAAPVPVTATMPSGDTAALQAAA